MLLAVGCGVALIKIETKIVGWITNRQSTTMRLGNGKRERERAETKRVQSPERVCRDRAERRKERRRQKTKERERMERDHTPWTLDTLVTSPTSTHLSRALVDFSPPNSSKPHKYVKK
jgi:hypothetical protein